MGALLSSSAAKEAEARRAAKRLAQSKTWVFTDFIDHQDPAEIDNTIDAIKHVAEDDLSDDEEVENVIKDAKRVLADVITRQLTHAVLERDPQELRAGIVQATSMYVPTLKDASLVPEAKVVLLQELKKRLKKGISSRRPEKLRRAIKAAQETQYFRGSTKTKAYASMQSRLRTAMIVLEEEEQKELDEEEARLADPLLQYVDVGPMLSAIAHKRVRLLKPEFIQYLKRNGRTLATRQELPERAFLDTDKLTPEELDKLKVIVVSFNHDSPNHVRHPDPDGYHLSTISALLEKYLSGHYSLRFDNSKEDPHHLISSKGKYMDKKQGVLFREQLWDRGFCFGAGDGRPTGVFIDWCCLYQDFPPGTRTVQQTKIFRHTLEHIESWYANRFTTVWMLTYPYQPPNELVVTLLRGRNLMIMDKNWFSKGGSSDPLARLSVDHMETLNDGKPKGDRRSITIKKTVNPEYNQTFVFPNVRGPENVNLDIIIEDEDWMSGNDFMGMARLSLGDIENKVPVTKWLPLANTYPPTRNKKGLPNVKGLKNFTPDYSVPRGEIEVRVEWRYNPHLEQMVTRRRRLAMSKGRVWLSIQGASGLLPADKNGLSDPYATSELIYLDGGDAIGKAKKHKTKTVNKTLSPQWNAEEVEWKDVVLGKAAVLIKIFDADMVTSAPLGSAIVPLCYFDEVDLLNGSEPHIDDAKVQTFQLETFGDMKEVATGELRLRGLVGVTERIKFPVADSEKKKDEMADFAGQVEMDSPMTVRAQLLFDEACARYRAIDKRVHQGEASWHHPSDDDRVELAEISALVKQAASFGHVEARAELEGRSEELTAEGKMPEKSTTKKNSTLDFVLVGARDLLAADRGGTSDPFAIVELVDVRTGKAMKPKKSDKTKTIKKTLEPTWDQRFVWDSIVADPAVLGITIKVYDADMVSKEILGEVTLPIKDWPVGVNVLIPRKKGSPSPASSPSPTVGTAPDSYELADDWHALSLKGTSKGEVQVRVRREEVVEEEEPWWVEEDRKILEAKKLKELEENWWQEPDYVELSDLSFHGDAWTAFFRSVASIFTRKGDLLDVSADERVRLIATDGDAVDNRDYMQFCLDTMDQREGVQLLTPIDFEDLIASNRIAQKSVDSLFAPIGQETEPKSDLVWLCERYKRTFDAIFCNARALSLAGSGLRDPGARRLIDIASRSSKRLVELDLSINDITVPIEEWAEFASKRRLLKLSLSMNREEGNADVDLHGTYTHGSDVGRKVIRGDVGCFAVATHLQYLDLSLTKIHGSIQPLGESLRNLTHLDLNRTKVEGDVSSLAPLTHLRYLDLFRCYKIGGAVGELRTLVGLKYLNLQSTDVEGSVEPLLALQLLTFLNLWSCKKLTGDKERIRSTMKRLRKDPWASDDRLMNHGRPEDPDEQLYIDDFGAVTSRLIGEDDDSDDSDEE